MEYRLRQSTSLFATPQSQQFNLRYSVESQPALVSKCRLSQNIQPAVLESSNPPTSQATGEACKQPDKQSNKQYTKAGCSLNLNDGADSTSKHSLGNNGNIAHTVIPLR